VLEVNGRRMSQESIKDEEDLFTKLSYRKGWIRFRSKGRIYTSICHA
jgi:hypothetical protein